MVLIGQVNPQLVAAINVHGPLAVGVSRRGRRADPRRRPRRRARLRRRRRVDQPDDPAARCSTTSSSRSSPPSAPTPTGQAYNINADTVAGAIAEALGAEKLVYLTDIEGLRRVVDDPASLIRQTTPDELDALMADGTIAGGMIPKVESCIHAVRNGVRRAHILDGRIAHVLLLEIFTDEGIGTMVQMSHERHAFDTSAAPDRLPVHAGVRAAAGDVRPRQRHRAVGRDGKRYLDFLGGLAVTSLGHAHPAVTEAIAEQAATLLHVSNFFANRQGDRGGDQDQRSCSPRRPAQVGQVFFCNRGAEANEAALKLARKFGGRGRHVVVSAFGSFHGRTLAALAATGQPAKHEPFYPMPDGLPPRRVRRPRRARGGDRPDGGRGADRAGAGRGWRRSRPTPSTCRGIRALCDERGLLMMVDEIQTGFGRTGRWFGFEHAGVVPDVVTHGQGDGQRLPGRGVLGQREVAAVFQPGDHGSTYSGTAIATAVVSAVIDEMRRIDAPGLAAERGDVPRRQARANSPASPASAATGCCSPPSWPTAATPRPSTPSCSHAGWSPTPSRRPRCGSRRRSPSARPRSTRRSRIVADGAGESHDAHLLDITDFTADELRAGARTSPSAPTCRPVARPVRASP